MDDIQNVSALKPDNRYYYWPHNHAGYLHHNGKLHRLIDLEPGAIPGALGPVDDGKSTPFDIMLSAALFNGDFFAITSHNNFSTPVFNELDTFGKSMGLSVVPGIEFTMPISAYNPEDVAILLSNMNEKLKEHSMPPMEMRKGSFRQASFSRTMISAVSWAFAASPLRAAATAREARVRFIDCTIE